MNTFKLLFVACLMLIIAACGSSSGKNDDESLDQAVDRYNRSMPVKLTRIWNLTALTYDPSDNMVIMKIRVVGFPDNYVMPDKMKQIMADLVEDYLQTDMYKNLLSKLTANDASLKLNFLTYTDKDINNVLISADKIKELNKHKHSMDQLEISANQKAVEMINMDMPLDMGNDMVMQPVTWDGDMLHMVITTPELTDREAKDILQSIETNQRATLSQMSQSERDLSNYGVDVRIVNVNGDLEGSFIISAEEIQNSSSGDNEFVF